MKVRMLTIAAGPTLVASPGQVITVSDEQGKDLVAGGFAERVVDAEKAETASADRRAASKSETSSLPAKGSKGAKDAK